MSFKDLELQESIQRALQELEFSSPTPIQKLVIPKVLEGLDLKISAQTGTGKTAAFLLPALEKVASRSAARFQGPRVLILVPTRELALQVATEAAKFGKHLPKVKTVCIYGGAPYPIQYRQLARPFDILVATPGRLIDHIERRRVDLSQVEMLILDEADRMLDMGFIEPVEQISAQASLENRQTLLFSATLKGSVVKLSERLMKNPTEISVAPEHVRHDHIEQRMYYVDDINHKCKILDHILADPTINQAIIFTSTKRFADELVDGLLEKGSKAAALHGDMNQNQRNRTIVRLRKGEIQVLVATDVAARGIDVQTISHVINFDLPNCTEDYVHRIGRTGRAGATGIALSFAGSKDRYLVPQIERFTGQPIAVHTVPGLEPRSKSAGGGRPSSSRGGPSRFRSAPPREGQSRFRSGSDSDRPSRFGSSDRGEGAPSRFRSSDQGEGAPSRFRSGGQSEGGSRFRPSSQSEGPSRFRPSAHSEGPSRFQSSSRPRFGGEGERSAPSMSKGRPPRFGRDGGGQGNGRGFGRSPSRGV